ncbi:MAG: hypothetical protein JNK66_05310 [Chitinophagales bacterium]|nr:hypothetical protein [Chitinophagales bacterium]
MNRENIFVFVVCGGVEHIDALHYSLKALRRVSKHRLIVLTDSLRNEIAIEHDDIIDVATPEKYNHHQASIYLKTGIHKFLPKGNLYCYLDTDVIALDESADDIFNEYAAPITFAPDHCVTDQFSPSAMKCGCAEKFEFWETELKFLFSKYKDLSRQPENLEKKRRLEKKLADIKKNPFYYKWISFRFNFSRNIFKLDDDNFLDKRKNLWIDRNGQPILYEKDVQSAVEAIESTTLYRLDKIDGKRWLREGLDVFDARCNHLKEAIKMEFDIDVITTNWQHWNGGVFLFDDSSVGFLESWHQKTIQTFELTQWKTRDQGTLIATAWEFGLQQHKTLPKKFNLIADYGHKKIQHLGSLTFEFGDMEIVKPALIHIYHHWADLKWEVWNEVERTTGIATDPDASTVNGLWIGNKLSKIELLTIHSFLKFGHRFRLWLYEPLETKLPEGVLIGDAHQIIPRENIFRYKNKSQFGHGKGSVAGFSDIFRYKLLFDKGGWWVDMDITCLKPLDYEKPYFFRKHHNLNVVGNVMKCPKGSELMKRCYDEAFAEVNEHNTDWHKPIDILNKHIEALNLKGYIVNDISNQDRWDDTGRFIYGATDVPKNWNFIHWQNEEWRNQNLDKENFPHQGKLASLLSQYGLFEPPKSRWQEWINEWQFSFFYRKIKWVYFRLTSQR